MDPREATASDHVPEHLVILGGGVVGCEMATFNGSFQKQVTLISSSSALLPRFEPEAGKRVQKALEERRVSVQVFTDVKAFRKKEEGFEAELSKAIRSPARLCLLRPDARPTLTTLDLSSLESMIRRSSKWTTVSAFRLRAAVDGFSPSETRMVEVL